MIEINLLPWRGYRRLQEKKNTTLFLIFAFVFTLVICVSTYYLANQYLQTTHAVIHRLQQQLSALKKAPFSARNDQALHAQPFIHQIRQRQIELIEVLNTLMSAAQITWLTLSKQNESVFLSGEIDTFSTLAFLMEQLKPLPLEIDSVKNVSDSNVLAFRLRLILPEEKQ